MIHKKSINQRAFSSFGKQLQDLQRSWLKVKILLIINILGTIKL
jgi:hypothetical protein